MIRLVEREGDLEPFATFHMEGHWDADGDGLIGAIRRVVGKPGLKVRRFPWWLLAVAAPVVPLFRELREMRYLWRAPVRLDNGRLLRSWALSRARRSTTRSAKRWSDWVALSRRRPRVCVL